LKFLKNRKRRKRTPPTPRKRRTPTPALKKVSSGGKYEEIVGYSRAVKAGNQVFVSGTGSVDPMRRTLGANEVYVQTNEALKTIDSALRKLGGSLENIVRTRVFVRADADWTLVAKAHREAFGKTRPASTWLVGTFLDPNILVEIEADAVL
jgi:enamine deaminase RidA (YjgF/YER057c/UK114 family)